MYCSECMSLAFAEQRQHGFEGCVVAAAAATVERGLAALEQQQNCCADRAERGQQRCVGTIAINVTLY